MPLVVGHDEARKHPLRRVNQFAYFEFHDRPDMPHASLNGHGPNPWKLGTHFHQNDQFQVVTEGSFTMGRHQVAPYCVHFARAYTPYGPLVSDGYMAFLVMRARRDRGGQKLPEQQAQLDSVADRQPWQISRGVSFRPAHARGADVLLDEIPGMTDEHALAGYTMIVKPNAVATAPDPSRGDGQYIVVVKGSLWHDHVEHRAIALVFVKPDEGAYRIHAGTEGLEALVLNFPDTRTPRAQTRQAATTGLKRWQCALCAFEYDEAKGMPEEGIPPGTRWQDVPETWSCPDCSAAKSDFLMVESSSGNLLHASG